MEGNGREERTDGTMQILPTICSKGTRRFFGFPYPRSMVGCNHLGPHSHDMTLLYSMPICSPALSSALEITGSSLRNPFPLVHNFKSQTTTAYSCLLEGSVGECGAARRR
jgi:hypothetical protein